MNKMILADKITGLRKKSGWSQEELADKLNVSRQSISKWESAQSIPELDKILQMSTLFGVSTDYLLKDSAEQDPITQTDAPANAAERVSLERADAYLDGSKAFGKRIALGVLFCILSPVALLLLAVMADAGKGISEGIAAGIGISFLLIMVAAGVGIMIYADTFRRHWDFSEGTPLETEYGVSGIVRERLDSLEPRLTLGMIFAVILCILCPIPLIIACVAGAPDIICISMVCLLLAVVSVAVFLFILIGTVKGAHERLLSAEDYTPFGKKSDNEENAAQKMFHSVFWPVVTAGYLLWSFLSEDWSITWVVWPVAALISGAISAVLGFRKENGK